jgi:hypothetical protein
MVSRAQPLAAEASPSSLPAQPLAAAASPLAARNVDRAVDRVVLGTLEFPAWYPSPYPPALLGQERPPALLGERAGRMLARLWLCEGCFAYTREPGQARAHRATCALRPAAGKIPGQRVYQHPSGGWSVWEVDGEAERVSHDAEAADADARR